MKNLLGKKAKFTNGLTTKVGVIYDVTSAGDKVWIETDEDMYVVSMENVEVVSVKASASLEFDSYTCEEHGRSLTAYVNVKSEQAEEVFMALASVMKAELGEHFMGCPVDEAGYYSDGITVEYEHGLMTSIKEDIKHVFKMAKKQLGIR